MPAARTTIVVNAAHAGYEVLIEPGLLGRVGRCVAEVAPHANALLAVDEQIAGRYGRRANASLKTAGYTTSTVPLPARESDKTLHAVEALYEVMLAARLERGSPVIALGGGIIGDIAGFAAATYLRGVPFLPVPTTLLAMVDSAIGGKTGVNVKLPGGRLGKNLIGAFWQPKAVVVDPQLLESLDQRDFRCGLAECVKYAVLADESLLEFLSDNAADLARLQMDLLVTLIERCVRIKVEIVEQDERDTGRRTLLNLGHTFAHAIEAHQHLDLRHGEAVSIGLAAAAHLAVLTGRLKSGEQKRITEVLEGFRLPLRLPQAVEVDKLLNAMLYDKKASGGRLRLVLPTGLGTAEVTDDFPDSAVKDAWMHVGAVVVARG